MSDLRDKETIAGFAKGLRVIQAFDAGSPRLSISEVAARTGLQRATARRCLLTLAAGGYADFDGKYFRLTPRLLRLGHAYLASTPLPRLVQPWLEQLAQQTDESCSASILDGADIVYVARASQRRVMSIGLNVGSRLPAYCSSMGRVLLGALPERQQRSLLEATPKPKRTPRTLTEVEDLLAEIEQVRQQGYAVIDQELEIGLRSIAVPLHDTSGRVVAAINVGAQAERVAIETMRRDFLPRMQSIQQELVRLLN
ncbi:MAG TPA: IclR family transcriptional regulator [Devosiaceae bacterium]|nr:IclR family transcriptional regulator [Devosiaceae bacterium]